MSRRAFEIIAASGEGLVEPKTFEEATSRKTRLQAEIEALQAELANKDQRDEQGQRLDLEAFNAWRTGKIRVLHAKQQELRSLKNWISMKNGGAKPSEWALLARCHHFLNALDEQNALPADKAAEAEQLLDSIEFVVPGAFLQRREAMG